MTGPTPERAVTDPGEPATDHPQPVPAAQGSLPFRLSMQNLQEIAGISALGSFVFAIAATISAAAYLSAWGITATLVTLSPLAALTKAGELIYTFVFVGLIWVVLSEGHHRTRHHPRLLAVVLVVVAVVIAALAFESASRGFYGATLASIATYVLFIGLRIVGRIPLAATILALVIVILLMAYQTGHELGIKRQQTPSEQTHLQLTLRTPIAGMPGVATDASSFEYSNLYFIFQDDQYLFVGSNSAPGHAYMVGLGQIVAITVLG